MSAICLALVYPSEGREYERDSNLENVWHAPSYILYYENGKYTCMRYDYMRYLIKYEGLVVDFTDIDSNHIMRTLEVTNRETVRYPNAQGYYGIRGIDLSIKKLEDVVYLATAYIPESHMEVIDLFKQNEDLANFVVRGKLRDKGGKKFTKNIGYSRILEF